MEKKYIIIAGRREWENEMEMRVERSIKKIWGRMTNTHGLLRGHKETCYYRNFLKYTHIRKEPKWRPNNTLNNSPSRHLMPPGKTPVQEYVT